MCMIWAKWLMTATKKLLSRWEEWNQVTFLLIRSQIFHLALQSSILDWYSLLWAQFVFSSSLFLESDISCLLIQCDIKLKTSASSSLFYGVVMGRCKGHFGHKSWIVLLPHLYSEGCVQFAEFTVHIAHSNILLQAWWWAATSNFT